MTSRFCDQCGASGTKMLRCGKCKEATYCSKECQTDAWKRGHKTKCVAAAPTAPPVVDTAPEIATMPTKALKQLLDAHGMDFSKCIEKSELRALAATLVASGSGGGGDKPVEDGEECAICLDVLRQPQTMPCSHQFCRECVAHMRQHGVGEEQVCPLCRGPMPDVERMTFEETLMNAQYSIWETRHLADATNPPPHLAALATKGAALCRHMIQIDPQRGNSFFSLSLWLARSGDNGGAISACRRTIELGIPEPGVRPAGAYVAELSWAYNHIGKLVLDRGGGIGEASETDIDEAEEAFRASIAADPKNSKSHLNLGNILHNRRGDSDGAEAALRTSAAIDPGGAGAWATLSQVLLKRGGDLSAAETAARKAAQSDQLRWDVQHILGDVLEARNNLLGAEKAFREAVRLGSPNHVPTYHRIGKVLHKQGDVEGALKALRLEVRERPDHSQAHALMIEIMLEKILAAEAAGERPDKAAMVRVLKAASSIGPDDKESWAPILAIVEKQIRDDAKGAGVEQRAATDKEATVRAALAADPLNPMRHLMLAQSLQRQNDVKGAKACLNAALEIDPHSSSARIMLGGMLRQCGDVDGAEAALRAVVIPDGAEAVVPPEFEIMSAMTGTGNHLASIQSNYAIAQNNLGDLLRIEREDFVGAATAFRAAAAADPTFLQAHENLGSLLMDAMGDLAGAEAVYSEVLRFDPECHHARIQIARASVYLRGEMAGPEATYRAAIAADPTRSDAYFRLAVDILGRRNDIDGAAANLRKCIAFDPKRREAHANLAVSLWQKDDIDGAEASLRHAIAVHPKYAHAHLTHGMLLALGRGDLAGAARKFAAVLKFDPAHEQAKVGQLAWRLLRILAPVLTF